MQEKNVGKPYKSAFTLIELLAVIIILAIVALIATPIILDVIEDAEKSANLSEANLILSGAETFYATSRLTEENEELFDGKENVYDFMDLTGETLEYATIKIDKEGKITLALWIDNKCYEKASTEEKIEIDETVTEGSSCASKTDVTEPEVPSTENITVALPTGLVPVKISYDENDSVASGIITVADTNEEWYDYDNSEWANAVVVNDETYRTAAAGTIIPTSAIEQMYVYIPRYKYEIFSSNTPITVNIEFEDKDVDTKEVVLLTSDPASVAGEWLTHPAFSYTEEDGTTVELDGIWVGKFEQGSESKIIPNINSYGNFSMHSLYTLIINGNGKNGLNSTSDIHMLKNSEWGAILYLSQSNYGICKTAPNENCSQSISNSLGSDGYKWNTPNGVIASTTHNITGIYDMAGENTEYMMAVGNQEISSLGIDPAPKQKYYDNYELASSDNIYTFGLLGDATKEMQPSDSNVTWNESDAYFINSVTGSWFRRGGLGDSVSDSDAFAFHNSGAFNSYNSGRSALWVIE